MGAAKRPAQSSPRALCSEEHDSVIQLSPGETMQHPGKHDSVIRPLAEEVSNFEPETDVLK